MMTQVYLLHLDTSTKACSVALSLNGEVVSFKETNDDAYSHGEKLTLFVEEVLQQAKISFKDLKGVSLASGPGSYTGLRIGASTAKGFCYSLEIPLLSMDSLTSLFNLAKEKYPDTTICTMLDARRMEVYSAFFGPQGECTKDISADILDETSYAIYEPFVCVGDAVPKMKEVWKGRSILFDETIFCSARGQAKTIYEKFLHGEFEDVAYYEPFYLKDFITNKPKSK